MLSRTAIVASKVGLHARPAAIFANAVADSGFDIIVESKGGRADGASLIEVMSLGVGHGEEVTLTCEDATAGDALDSLVELLSQDLDA